ncbi:MAG: hypothetical protein ONB23_12110 [candidate division KSB1 bacterium]|nr:hypothetical protein [candidate division KSB1 bacterium]
MRVRALRWLVGSGGILSLIVWAGTANPARIGEAGSEGYIYVNPEASSSMRYFWVFRPLQERLLTEAERVLAGDSTVWYVVLRHHRQALLSGCIPPPWLVFWDSVWSARGKTFSVLRKVDGAPWDSCRGIPYELRLDQVDTLVAYLGFPAGELTRSAQGESLNLLAHVELKTAMRGTLGGNNFPSQLRATSPGDPTCPQLYRLRFDLEPPVLVHDSTRLSAVGGNICAYGWEPQRRTFYAPYDAAAVRASFVVDDRICRAVDSVAVVREGLSVRLGLPPSGYWSTPARLLANLTLPEANGEYAYRVAVRDTALAADPYDPAAGRIRYRRDGNWRNVPGTADFRLVVDRAAAERSLTIFRLHDPDTGDPGVTDNRDRLRATVQFARLWSPNDWAIRGIWKVAVLEGRRGPESFACATGIWARAWEVPKAVLTEGLTFQWDVTLSGVYQPGEAILVTAAFLDSSGIVSDTVTARILFKGPVHLAFSLEDPTPQSCQDSQSWTNDRDSLRVRLVLEATDAQRIDSILVRYNWTSLTWGKRFPQGLPHQFLIPVKGIPSECQAGSVLIEALETETGARTTASDSIRFDFTQPAILEPFLRLLGTQAEGADRSLSCEPFPGWTAGRDVVASVGMEGFVDNCQPSPVRLAISGDLRRTIDTCAAQSDSLVLSLLGSAGPKTLWAYGMDAAGNWPSLGDSDLIVYDPIPVDSARVTLLLYRTDRLNARVVLADRWAPDNWAIRGAWKVAFRLGVASRGSFACTTGIWGDRTVAFELPVQALVVGAPLEYPLPPEFDTGKDTIWVTAAFLDSSGVISGTVRASFLQLPFSFEVADPTPAPCQDRYAWTNDRDAILLQVRKELTNQRRIDSLAVRFDWTDTVVSWTGVGLPDSLLVPLPSVPEGDCGVHWITAEAWERATGARSSLSRGIRFDFEPPALGEDFLTVGGTRKDSLDCWPVASWTAAPQVSVELRPGEYGDNCSGTAARVRLGLGGIVVVDTCASGMAATVYVGDGPGARVLEASAWDLAGNRAAADEPDTVVFDPVAADTGAIRLSLADLDGGSVWVTDDAGAVRVQLVFLERWAPENWAMRGLWKVGFSEGKLAREAFACSAFDWGDSSQAHVLPLPAYEGGVCNWVLPLRGQYTSGDTIWVTAAFLDSSGVISEVKRGRIIYSPLLFSFQLGDPTPTDCQDRHAWTNDPDAILIQVDKARTNQGRIDSLAVHFDWTDSVVSWVGAGLPDSLLISLPSVPERDCGVHWITVEAWERGTRARSSVARGIRFDLEAPALEEGFLVVRGSRYDSVSCWPVTGWTATPEVEAVVGARGFADNCSEAPNRTRLELEGVALFDTCAGELARPIRVGEEPGVRVLSASASDRAGNWARVAETDTVIFDPIPVDTAQVRFWLTDVDGVSTQVTDNRDAVRARIALLAPWSTANWSVRGAWKIAFREGKGERLDFACSVFDWEDTLHAHALPAHAYEGEECAWVLPLRGGYAPGDTIWLTAAFLDSSGVVSEVRTAAIVYLPLEFSFRLADPTPETCQDRWEFTNDRDKVRLFLLAPERDRGRIDSLSIRFGWDGSQALTFQDRLPDSLDIELPSPPPECGPAVIRIEAWERSTRAVVASLDSIRFDFSPPRLTSDFLRLTGSKGSGAACDPLPGWTATDLVEASLGLAGFTDNCTAVPVRLQLGGSISQTVDTCSADLALGVRLTIGPGVAWVMATAMDGAGNWAAAADRDSIVYDPVPADSTVLVSLHLIDPDSACGVAIGARTDDSSSVRVCLHLRAWDGASWALRGLRDAIGVEGRVAQADCGTFTVSTPKPVVFGQPIGFDVALSGHYDPGDTIWVSVFLRDSSGVISQPFYAGIPYLPYPSVAIRVWDDDDPGDETYVDESVAVRVDWARVPKTSVAGLQVVHRCPAGDLETLLDTTVTTSGSLERRFRISVQPNACYDDSLTAILLVGQDVATDRARFCIDLVPPRITSFCVVGSSGSEQCLEQTTVGGVYARVTAEDAGCGALKGLVVYYQHSTASGPPDSALAGIVPCAGSKAEVWVPVNLPTNQTGWWRLWARAMDCQEQPAVSDVVQVDYRPEGRAAFCYPNPYRPRIDPRVCFSVYSESAGPGEVAIWDAFGFLVKRWTVSHFKVGVNDGCDGIEGLTWDGRNGANELVSSGGYICRVRTPDGREHTIKVGILR